MQKPKFPRGSNVAIASRVGISGRVGNRNPVFLQANAKAVHKLRTLYTTLPGIQPLPTGCVQKWIELVVWRGKNARKKTGLNQEC
jgi:hypothetical protein